MGKGDNLKNTICDVGRYSRGLLSCRLWLLLKFRNYTKRSLGIQKTSLGNMAYAATQNAVLLLKYYLYVGEEVSPAINCRILLQKVATLPNL